METINVAAWKAKDGRVFNSQFDCEKYEEELTIGKVYTDEYDETKYISPAGIEYEVCTITDAYKEKYSDMVYLVYNDQITLARVTAGWFAGIPDNKEDITEDCCTYTRAFEDKLKKLTNSVRYGLIRCRDFEDDDGNNFRTEITADTEKQKQIAKGIAAMMLQDLSNFGL